MIVRTRGKDLTKSLQPTAAPLVGFYDPGRFAFMVFAIAFGRRLWLSSMAFAMKRVLQFLHHRSLIVSMVALLFGFVALAFLPEHRYREQYQGSDDLVQAGIAAGMGLIVCAVTLVVLLRDSRSGYPSMRCSLATLLWAFACFPVLFLSVLVARGLLR